MKTLLFLSILLLALLQSCSWQVGSRVESKSSDTIRFGKIEAKSVAKLDSKAEIAGLQGVLLDKDLENARMAAANINRAKQLASVTDAYLYEIKLLDGETIKVVSEKDFFARKDCVAVEKLGSLNIRRIDDEICLKSETKPEKTILDAAYACSVAKRQLIFAQDDQALSEASQQVVNACQFSN